MRLILTRHGETVENNRGILAGHLPGELSEKGFAQARMLAGRLRGEIFDCVYSSDLKRAADTTGEIMKYHPGIPVVYDKRLRETDYRGLTGKSKSLFDFDNWSPDAESRSEMQARAGELLDDVYKKHADESVLFVGHAGINRAVISVILGKPAEYMREIRGVTNTAVTVFEIKENSHTVHLLNCTRHLD